MLIRLAELGNRFPKRVLLGTAALLIAATLFGLPVAGYLSAGGFADPAAPSSVAKNDLATTFHAGDPNLILQLSAPGGVQGSAARRAGERLAAQAARQPYVQQVSSYWSAPPQLATALRSSDGKRGLVLVSVAGDDDAAPKRAAAIRDTLLAHREPGVRIIAGGQALAYHEVTERISTDLAAAEAVAVPLTALLLFWVFGSVVAALVPLAVGLVATLGTLAVLRGLTMLTDVSVYALNLTTALGLALAIDYSLFIVSRYREEVLSGKDRPAAVRTAMATAGRTVLFSAVTVALSLAALLVFPAYFLRSFAYAGIAVVALAALAALLVLPAVLIALGPRIDALDLRRPLRRLFHRPPPRPSTVEHSFWYRVAERVMRRPVLVGLAATAVLLVLASPFLGVRFGYPDDRVLPPDSATHQLGDALRTGYPTNAAGTLSIVLPDTGNPGSTGSYAARLSTIDGVAAVNAPAGLYANGSRVGPGDPAMAQAGSSYLVVRSAVEPLSTRGAALLSDVESTPAPGRTLITGAAAENADSVASIGDRLPLAFGWIALATFVALFLFTGSILLPLKALVLNALSLSATFGAMVWIFQDGHLLGLYGSTATGFLVATMPVLMFCLAFGTSMDYEVFLLSRIRERWLASARGPGDNERAVALGLGATGRIVTAAAGLMAIVFAALATGSVSFMQMFGTGLMLAVLVDATVVRGVLVPAFMRLAGRANWWAPGRLARWHARHGWTEAGDAPGDTPGRTRERVVVETG